MKDRIFENSLKIIRKYLSEEGAAMATPPTNSLSSGKIAGTKEAGDGPPVNLKRKKPQPFNDLFRRTSSVQPKYPS